MLLRDEDRCHILNGSDLNDRIINAAQILLKQDYRVGGLQHPVNGQRYKFKPISKKDTDVVQILHTGKASMLTC